MYQEGLGVTRVHVSGQVKYSDYMVLVCTRNVFGAACVVVATEGHVVGYVTS